MKLGEEKLKRFLPEEDKENKEDRKPIKVHKQAIRADPNNVKAHYNLGMACNKLGLYNEAVEAFKQATCTNPNNAEAYYNLGIAYDRLRLHNEAVKAYERPPH